MQYTKNNASTPCGLKQYKHTTPVAAQQMSNDGNLGCSTANATTIPATTIAQTPWAAIPPKYPAGKPPPTIGDQTKATLRNYLNYN